MSLEPASSADGGALNIDQAAGLLGSPVTPEEDAAPAEAAEETEIEETPAEPTAEAEDAEAEAEAEAEETEQDEPEEPAIDPPHSWDAEAKAEFAQLPRKAQEIILAREGQRDKAVSEAQQRAAETVKRAEAEASHIGEFKSVLDQFLPRARQVFAGRWEGIDWAQWAQEDPTEAFKGKLQYEAEHGEMQRLEAAQQHAQKLAYAKYMEAEAAKLPEMVPDLADKENGPARKDALRSYLASEGLTDADIAQAGALHLKLAYKAMRFDELEAKARTALTNKPTPAARPVLKPGAAPQGSSKTREVERLNRRLGQTGKVDDAVALLMAKG
jgi:hypothetical protein